MVYGGGGVRGGIREGVRRWRCTWYELVEVYEMLYTFGWYAGYTQGKVRGYAPVGRLADQPSRLIRLTSRAELADRPRRLIRLASLARFANWTSQPIC